MLRKRLSMLLAAVLVWSYALAAALPAYAEEQGGDEPHIRDAYVIPGESWEPVQIFVDLSGGYITAVESEGIKLEGIDNQISEVYPDNTGLKIWLADPIVEPAEFTVVIDEGSVQYGQQYWNQAAMEVEVSTADRLSYYEASSATFGPSETNDLTFTFKATEALVGGEDYVDIVYDNLGFDIDVWAVIEYENVDHGIIHKSNHEITEGRNIYRAFLPDDMYIAAGDKVTVKLQNVLNPEFEGVNDFYIRTSQNDAFARSQVWVYTNDNNVPGQISVFPNHSYTNESPEYTITFATPEQYMGTTFRFQVPHGFGINGEPFPGQEIHPEDYSDLVEVTVTGAVYGISEIHAYEDGGKFLRITTDRDVLGNSQVSITLKGLLTNPPNAGLYALGMVDLADNYIYGDLVYMPVTIERGQTDPEEPPEPPEPNPGQPLLIPDLELSLSNSNSYLTTGEEGSPLIHIFGNGEDVEYTFTGTAVTDSDYIRIVIESEMWYDEVSSSDVSVRVNGEEVQAVVDQDGNVLNLELYDSNNPEEPYLIQAEDSFEVRLVMDNPEILIGEQDYYDLPIELSMNQASGRVTAEIKVLNPIMGMTDPYAGVSDGEYLFMVADTQFYGGFEDITIQFPDEVEMPSELSLDDLVINAIGYVDGEEFMGPLESKDVRINGQSLNISFEGWAFLVIAIIPGDVGIPTPEAAGTYEYIITYQEQDHVVAAELTEVQADPVALSAVPSESLVNPGLGGTTVDVWFDEDLDHAVYGLTLGMLFGEEEPSPPYTIEYEQDGEFHQLPVCDSTYGESESNLLRIQAGCGWLIEGEGESAWVEEIEAFNASKEAYVTIDNLGIRHPDGSYSPGSQRVRIITEGTRLAIVEKLNEHVPEGETLNIGYLIQAMSDEQLIGLFGDSLDAYDIEILLENITPKYVEPILYY